MKDVKRRLETFSFYDRSGLERHLAEMAQKGWLPEKIGRFLWTYRKIEPKKVAFSVCYFPKATEFDPEPSEEQQTFYDFCAHTGWTLAASNAQLQVFYNERENPVPIETDPVLEVEAIHRAAKPSFVFVRIAQIIMALIWVVPAFCQLFNTPIQVLCTPIWLFALIACPLLIAYWAAELAGYFLWRRKALRAAEQGEFLDTRSCPALYKALLAAVLAGAAVTLAATVSTLPMPYALICALAPVYGLLIAAILLGIKGLMKRKKASASTNFMAVRFMAGFLSFLSLGLLAGIIFSVDQNGDSQAPGELPLTLAELAGISEGYNWRTDHSRTFLLDCLSAYQSGGQEADSFHLDYQVVAVKLPALYGPCRAELLARYDARNNGRVAEGEKMWYEPADPAPWGAGEVYRRYHQKYGLRNEFLLCYPKRIVEISFSGWEPDPAQMKLVGERLGGFYNSPRGS